MRQRFIVAAAVAITATGVTAPLFAGQSPPIGTVVSGVPDWYSTGGGAFSFSVSGNDSTFIVPRSDNVEKNISQRPGIEDCVTAVLNDYYGPQRSISFTVIAYFTRQGDSTPLPAVNFCHPTPQS